LQDEGCADGGLAGGAAAAAAAGQAGVVRFQLLLLLLQVVGLPVQWASKLDQRSQTPCSQLSSYWMSSHARCSSQTAVHAALLH
jgi:hypothetical protein